MTTGDLTRVSGPCSEGDAFVRDLGLRVQTLEKACAVIRVVLGDRHVNDHGIAHGGALFTFADSALALLANLRRTAVTTSATIRYLSPARAGDELRVSARLAHETGRRGFYVVEITRGHELIALLHGEATEVAPRGRRS